MILVLLVLVAVLALSGLFAVIMARAPRVGPFVSAWFVAFSVGLFAGVIVFFLAEAALDAKSMSGAGIHDRGFDLSLGAAVMAFGWAGAAALVLGPPAALLELHVLRIRRGVQAWSAGLAGALAGLLVTALSVAGWQLATGALDLGDLVYATAVLGPPLTALGAVLGAAFFAPPATSGPTAG